MAQVKISKVLVCAPGWLSLSLCGVSSLGHRHIASAYSFVTFLMNGAYSSLQILFIIHMNLFLASTSGSSSYRGAVGIVSCWSGILMVAVVDAFSAVFEPTAYMQVRPMH